MSCGVDEAQIPHCCGCGAGQQLQLRLELGPMAQEPPYAASTALDKQNTNKRTKYKVLRC